MQSSSGDLTALLLDWVAGEEDALARLTPVIYEDLKKIARNRLKDERVGHTLQPTALVNEAFMRLVNQKRVRWSSRAHFFAVSARIMRRILVDHARRRRADKRHGLAAAVTLDIASDLAEPKRIDLVRLDDALETLVKLDPRQSRIVELRFFAGLTIAETAEALRISAATVKVDWAMAKAWLFNELEKS